MNFTFAVIGRNEADRLHVAVGDARVAAGPGDRVVFVDSGSDDDSCARAAALGVEVIAAPRGKGRAVQAALAACTTDYICFCDGDMKSSSDNIPALLRDAAIATRADLIVGVYTEPVRRWAITPGIYMPLVTELFPDALAAGIEIPLSGLRALRTGFDIGDPPDDYGIETYLNLHVPLHDGIVANCALGEFVGPLRGFKNLPEMGENIGRAILDYAVKRGRVAPAVRPEWDAWVQVVVDVIATMPPPEADAEEYQARLLDAAARPLPVSAPVARSVR